jgi:hypothetical protein
MLLFGIRLSSALVDQLKTISSSTLSKQKTKLDSNLQSMKIIFVHFLGQVCSGYFDRLRVAGRDRSCHRGYVFRRCVLQQMLVCFPSKYDGKPYTLASSIVGNARQREREKREKAYLILQSNKQLDRRASEEKQLEKNQTTSPASRGERSLV